MNTCESESKISRVILLVSKGRLRQEGELVRRLESEGFPVQVIRDRDKLEAALASEEYYHTIVLAEFWTIKSENDRVEGYKKFLSIYAGFHKNRRMDLMLMIRQEDDDIQWSCGDLVSAFTAIPFDMQSLLAIVRRKREEALNSPDSMASDLDGSESGSMAMDEGSFASRWAEKVRELGLDERSGEMVRASIQLPGLDEESRRLLMESGLPRSASPFVSFDEVSTMPRIWEMYTPEVWNEFKKANFQHNHVIGSDRWKSPICIDDLTGQVWVMDRKTEFERHQFMNSSVSQLAECLLAYMGEKDLGKCREAIMAIDSTAMTEGSFWFEETADTGEESPGEGVDLPARIPSFWTHLVNYIGSLLSSRPPRQFRRWTGWSTNWAKITNSASGTWKDVSEDISSKAMDADNGTTVEKRDYRVIILAEEGRLPGEELIVQRIAEEGFIVKIVRGEDDLRQELECKEPRLLALIAEFITLCGRIPIEGEYAHQALRSQLSYLVFSSCADYGLEPTLLGDSKYMQFDPYGCHGLHCSWMCFPIDLDQLAHCINRMRRYLEDDDLPGQKVYDLT